MSKGEHSLQSPYKGIRAQLQTESFFFRCLKQIDTSRNLHGPLLSVLAQGVIVPWGHNQGSPRLGMDRTKEEVPVCFLWT